MSSKHCCLNACCSAFLARLLCICDQEAKPGASLLAFAEYFLIGPDAEACVTVRQDGYLVASCVPPTTDSGDDFPD